MPDTDELTHSDIEGAVTDLVRLSGLPGPDIWAAVRECAGGERDAGSLAYGVSQVADALGLTDYSDDERRELAARGWALPDGTYPIKNEDDLSNAATLAKSGHGDAEAAKALIAKRARELGVANPLDSGDDDEDQDVAASYSRDQDMVDSYLASYPPESYYAWTGQQPVALTDTSDWAAPGRFDPYDEVDNEVLRLAAGSPAAAQMFGLELAAPDYGGHGGPHGTGGADEIIARHRDILGGRADRGNTKGIRRGLRTAHAEAEGGRGRHLKTCPRGCTRDHNQPRHGGETHPEIRALMERHPHMFGADSPQSGNHTHHPLSPAARESAERAARPGHTGYR